MSIIYEALRKVEKQQKAGLSVPDAGRVVNGIREKRKTVISVGKKKLFLITVSILFIAAALFFLNVNLTASKDSRLSLSAINKIKNPEKTKINLIPAQEALWFKKRVPKEYRLEGIVQDEKGSFAVINGRIVKESDKVGNFSVTAITGYEVEMINSSTGAKLTLSL